MKITRIILLAATALSLSACNSGINHTLDTGHGVDSYKASLAEAVKKMEKPEIEAYDWAVSDLSIDKVHELYPNGTPKQIIHGESKKMIEGAAELRPELEKQIPGFDRSVKELTDNIVVESTNFTIENDFFGLQPKVSARVAYAEGRPMTALQWRIELFIDGKDKPVASTTVTDDYKGDGGFKSGYRYARDFKLGFVRGDDRFTTLEIQNSKTRILKMTLIPDECIEINGHAVSYNNPHIAIRQLDETVAKARRYKEL